MDKEEKIIDLIITMIEQSNERMKQISATNKDYRQFDAGEIKLAQKEFEMQIKLLDKVVKNFKGGKGLIDITPERLQKNKV